ncbi:tripartite-type tricarboxylate transporter receptor subunit TctC [Humitalea rosea]|uniref:Tripartite-type tricarboxylate transporter receptor subunit TctC n=1 Tax=Humitalea rosea TaxID=990373 RepID=A0A2W7KG22_9PROT|nr:tripartite tricarboxylate transporter substrate binding protein [Humitalea rosea]PZW46629.1 tripartite-type tricarboxylate transporter receptor subunit TctC [Humitalea rosea]
MNITRRALPALGLLAAGARGATAQGIFPDRVVRMIVPFPAGGATDAVARAVGREFQTSWGQPVVPENRPGANGTIAGQLIARSPADGYTLGLVAIGHAINPFMYANIPYDTDRDFTPIGLLATYPLAVLVPGASPIRDIEGLIHLAKTRATPLTYASGGNGSSQHLATALFANMAGINLVQVPYRGGAPALMDTVAGNVDLIVTLPPVPMIQSGMMRALAVTSRQRLSWLPDVPTLAEAGLPRYESVAWYGLVGPAGMPPDLLRQISEATVRAVASQTLRNALAPQGGEPASSTPEEFVAFLQAERRRYEVIMAAGSITPD